MAAFTSENGNWTDFRERLALLETDEVDLHFGRRDHNVSYDDAMADVEALVENSLHQAQKNNRPYVMFVHGHSTSRPGKTTARSVVRGFMRSKAATPLIVKAECIQHSTVFVARIKEAVA